MMTRMMMTTMIMKTRMFCLWCAIMVQGKLINNQLITVVYQILLSLIRISHYITDELKIYKSYLPHPVVILRVKSRTRLEVRHALGVPVTGPTVSTTCVHVRSDTYSANQILRLIFSSTDESGALTTVGEVSILALLLITVIGTALA